MKTLTQTLIATAFTAIILGSSAVYSPSLASYRQEQSNDVSGKITFNKISVSGNVKVILIQADKEAVKVDENFDPAKTSIKRNGYNLMIYSSEINPITVTVSVKDLQRIDVSGISSVETKGKFDLDYLQIFMSYSSSANINAKTGSLYTVISDASELKLSGSAGEHTFIANQSAKADLDQFICNGPERLTSEAIAAISLNRAVVGKSK